MRSARFLATLVALPMLLANGSATAMTVSNVTSPSTVVIQTAPATALGNHAGRTVDRSVLGYSVELDCSGRIPLPGGSDSCSRSFNVRWDATRLSARFAATWALLASGSMTWKLTDAIGTYGVGGCAAPRPALTGSDVHCEFGFLRPFAPGNHTLSVNVSYGTCLQLSCPWGLRGTIDIETLF